MQTLKLLKKSDWYFQDSATSPEVEILGNFLTSDVNSGAKGYKELILSNQDETAGNFSWLKNENNVIKIGFLYDDEDPNAPVFEISKTEFIKLLEEWEKLYKLAPNEIIITFENGIINIEGKN